LNRSRRNHKIKDKHITDIHICSRCSTVSITGNDKCPSCGADEHSGWQRSEVRANQSRTDSIKNQLKNAGFLFSKFWKNNWKPIIATLVPATFVFLFVPAGTFYLLIIISIPAGMVYFIYRYIFNRQEKENLSPYQMLLNMAQGDKDLVSRMIENEHRRNPDGNIEEWVSSAIERWQREVR